jgi:uncharacterized membrane protein
MTNLQYNRGAINASDCIGMAWNLVSSKFWLYIGVGLLTMLLISCIPIVNLFLIGPVLGGYYYFVLRDLDGEPVDFGMMFKGFEKFVPLMVIGLIQAVPGIIFQIFRFTTDMASIFSRRGIGNGRGDFFQSSQPNIGLAEGLSIMIIIVAVAFLIFSIFWGIAFFFAVPLAMEHNLGPIEAIKLSASAGFSNAGGIILLFILSVLVALLGLIALCLGIFVAIPVIYAANAIAYRHVFPRLSQSRWNTPPPPSAYGSTFGQGT